MQSNLLVAEHLKSFDTYQAWKEPQPVQIAQTQARAIAIRLTGEAFEEKLVHSAQLMAAKYDRMPKGAAVVATG